MRLIRPDPVYAIGQRHAYSVSHVAAWRFPDQLSASTRSSSCLTLASRWAMCRSRAMRPRQTVASVLVWPASMPPGWHARRSRRWIITGLW